ncbi:MAG TPA: Hsp20/alpha crystallin family protein [bacterium]|nr:Hsp20/alpha crystallin family protein [bacterium]
MALIRWDPFAELGPFREDLGRLFDRYSNLVAIRGWQPAIDLYEENDAFILKAEIPGVEPEDVDITVSTENITLRGVLDRKHEEQRQGYIRSERHQGEFARSLTMPAEIKPDQAKATFKNGVVTVVLPKVKPGQRQGIKLKIDRMQ